MRSTLLPCHILLVRFRCTLPPSDNIFIPMCRLLPSRNPCHEEKFRQATFNKETDCRPRIRRHLCLKTSLPIRVHHLKRQPRPAMKCRHPHVHKSRPQTVLAIRSLVCRHLLRKDHLRMRRLRHLELHMRSNRSQASLTAILIPHIQDIQRILAIPSIPDIISRLLLGIRRALDRSPSWSPFLDLTAKLLTVHRLQEVRCRLHILITPLRSGPTGLACHLRQTCRVIRIRHNPCITRLRHRRHRHRLLNRRAQPALSEFRPIM